MEKLLYIKLCYPIKLSLLLYYTIFYYFYHYYTILLPRKTVKHKFSNDDTRVKKNASYFEYYMLRV